MDLLFERDEHAVTYLSVLMTIIEILRKIVFYGELREDSTVFPGARIVFNGDMREDSIFFRILE